MNYDTGSRSITAHKEWTCEHCKQKIHIGEQHFARIKVIVPDKQKEYRRFHFACVPNLSDLTDTEREMIKKTCQNNFNQETLVDAIKKKLVSYEYQGYLTFFFCNSQASITKNFLVLSKDAQPFILSVAPNNAPIPRWLDKKFDFIKKNNGDVCKISTIEEFEAVLKTYVNNN